MINESCQNFRFFFSLALVLLSSSRFKFSLLLFAFSWDFSLDTEGNIDWTAIWPVLDDLENSGFNGWQSFMSAFLVFISTESWDELCLIVLFWVAIPSSLLRLVFQPIVPSLSFGFGEITWSKVSPLWSKMHHRRWGRGISARPRVSGNICGPVGYIETHITI